MSAHTERFERILRNKCDSDSVLLHIVAQDRQKDGASWFAVRDKHPLDGIEWVDTPDGIEADLGTRTITVERDRITIAHNKFGSRLVIQL